MSELSRPGNPPVSANAILAARVKRKKKEPVSDGLLALVGMGLFYLFYLNEDNRMGCFAGILGIVCSRW